MITPHESYTELAKAIGFSQLYLKREDQHPYGSHKGRSIPAMIDHYAKKGEKSFAVSSSGNAALAAALHVQKLNARSEGPSVRHLDLDIFVGNNIASHKLERIKKIEADSVDGHIRILIKERPLQALMHVTQEGVRSLRQSTDDYALVGYESLAKELAEIKGIGAVFMGTSSGTTAQALAQYFSDKKLSIQVHIIQTSSCRVLSETFETFDGPDEKSIADAIIDQTGQRKSVVHALIKKNGGNGWFATNENIKGAQELVQKKTGLEFSTNGVLSVVGAMQAAYRGWDIKGAVVCIVGGE